MSKKIQHSGKRPGTTSTPPQSGATDDLKAWASRIIETHQTAFDAGELAVLQAQAADLAVAPASHVVPPDPSRPTVVRTQQALDELAAAVRQADEIVVDLETSGLDHRAGVIVGIGLAVADGTAYVPLQHRFADTGELRPGQLALSDVAEALALHAKPLIAHNAKYELRWLRWHVAQEFKFVWDTMIAARLLRSHLPADLKTLAARELDAPAWDLSPAEMKQFDLVPIDKAAGYCAKDCWFTWQLCQRQRAAEHNEFVLQQVELPLVPIVAAMEDVGYRVDVDHFARLRATLTQELAETTGRIAEAVGDDFNPRSTQQLQHLLFTQLGEEPTKFTKTGQPSTDVSVLSQFAEKHEVVEAILQHRRLTKLWGTYCQVPDMVGGDQRLRVEFNQLAAETGRFASRSIIQTLPRDDAYGIRQGFVAAPGCQIVKADFAQQELCVLAQASGDQNMQQAVSNGTDLHGLAAVKVFGLDCSPNEVKTKYKARRDAIKAVQFGLLYGKTAYSLANDLEIAKEDAEQLIKDYFAQFPAVRQFVERVREQVATQGYVDDMFGRRRYLPDAQLRIPRKGTDQHGKILSRVNAAKRAAQNFVIQGAAATITKLAMIRCANRIREHYPDSAKLILTLHDELQFEVRDDAVAEFAGELPKLMCELGLGDFGFVVPLSVDVEVGPSWGATKPWEGDRDGQSSVLDKK